MKIYKEKDYKGEFNLLKMERDLMVRVLKMCNGYKSATARILGITPRSIFRKINLHEIKENEYLD
jgi:DNA-binding NtrC family response regulator